MGSINASFRPPWSAITPCVSGTMAPPTIANPIKLEEVLGGSFLTKDFNGSWASNNEILWTDQVWITYKIA